MRVTFTDGSDNSSEMLELGEETLVMDLKATLEALFGIPSNQLVLVKHGAELSTSTGSTLKEIGIVDNDFLIVVNSNTRRAASPPPVTSGGIYFKGMSVLDVLDQNKPAQAVEIVQNPANPELINELRYRDQKQLLEIFSKPKAQAIKALQKFMIVNVATLTVQKLKAKSNEEDMRSRLDRNPNDEEAKKYFDEKERKALIQEQYFQVMNNYPESLTRVLMLYIDVEVNGKKVQAFVDSGAQTSVMSLKCAKKLGIDRLIDERFSGKVVGVGSGQSLGRIHLAPLNIKNNFFPLSLTVLGGENGLGDKNMEFLLGLDMLKRHRASIDLVKGVLRFQGSDGNFVETEFLHEKDLDETKGGTKGFSPTKNS
eukprot:maker-scaffold_12-snap-gene-7.49-mRNA-1 protein AED:0.02 eAED:0.02 QI:63/1/1/1/1/1/3/21/368